jgi:hypothetical protein
MSSSSSSSYTYDVDPFTQVENRLWQIFESDPRIASLIRRKVKVEQEKLDVIANADVPEVELEPAGGTLELQSSRNLNHCVQRWQLRATTGEHYQRLALFPLKWALISALSRAGVTLHPLLFVHNVTVTDVRDQFHPAEDKGLEGWTHFVQIAVEMYFDRGAT